MIEANIKADAQPAARAINRIATISCPAPFERLEVLFGTPTIGNRTTRKPYEDQAIGGSDAADRKVLFEHDFNWRTGFRFSGSCS
jgi:hypothetical protein